MPEILIEEPYRFDVYHDFNKRVAGIRELFEECNLLLATGNQVPQLSSFETEFKDDFAGYCKANGVVP